MPYTCNEINKTIYSFQCFVKFLMLCRMWASQGRFSIEWWHVSRACPEKNSILFLKIWGQGAPPSTFGISPPPFFFLAYFSQILIRMSLSQTHSYANLDLKCLLVFVWEIAFHLEDNLCGHNSLTIKTWEKIKSLKQ